MKFDNAGWLDVAIEIDYIQKSMSRAGLKPTHIVLHATAGGSSAQNIANYFATGSEPASAHFVIGQDGTIVQGVNCNAAAWGNGIVDHPRIALPPGINPNLYTISIEHVKPSTDNSDQLTASQSQSSFLLVQALCDHYQIPKRAGDLFGGIISHADIDSISRARCPGPYPWNELWAFLKGGATLAPNKWQIADAQAEWQSTEALFGGTAPAYTSGIASVWRDHLYAGSRLGPPLSAEYDSADWGGNPIKVQQFLHARCEWRVDGTSCRWFDASGEIE
jgi:N-acetyl-anhydromuramyl-L-alanine amidase AmpD